MSKKLKPAQKGMKFENEEGAGPSRPKKDKKSTPEEALLELDEVMSRIFSLLDTSTLLTCRLVSRQFRPRVQSLLEERTQIQFICNDPAARASSKERLKRLTEHFEQSTSNRNEFPCRNFRFEKFGQLGDNDIQRFVNTYGLRIYKLTFIARDSQNNTPENALMDQLGNLLTRQAINIIELNLSVYPTVDWRQEIPQGIVDTLYPNTHPRNPNSPLLKMDPEYEEIFSRVESLPQKAVLKFLSIKGSGIAKTLEFLFKVAPNLKKVIIPQPYYVNLLLPVKRVHLLTNLEIVNTRAIVHVDSHNRIDWNLNRNVVKEMAVGNRLRPKKFSISFPDLFCSCASERDQDMELIINGILERNRDTLKSLFLNWNTMFFLPGIMIPSPMKELRKLGIVIEGEERRNENLTVLPVGFSLSETFPNLTIFQIVCRVKNYHSGEVCFEFLNCLEFGESWGDALSLEVKEVLLDIETSGVKRYEELPQPVLRRIHKFFPNASCLTFTST